MLRIEASIIAKAWLENTLLKASITTNGMSNRLKAAGRRGAHAWWLNALGRPSDDPAVLFTQPPGTILPLGGVDAGHKGYGLALCIEAMTGGLSGYGRADVPEGWGATVCVRVSDPEAFAGLGAFTLQTDWIAQACHGSVPRDPAQPVRLPGERAVRAGSRDSRGLSDHPPTLAPRSTATRGSRSRTRSSRSGTTPRPTARRSC